VSTFAVRGGVRCLPVVLVLLVPGALTGCQAAGEEPALRTASEFVTAVGSDPARACELLAPDTVEALESLRPEGCQRALPDLDLPEAAVTDVRVWGDAAQARSGQDTLFLRELDDGWRVVAAGCQAQEGGEPYQCVVQSS
jgi:hypothetical protein